MINTTLISENSFEAGWVGRPNAGDDCACLELVRVFGDRIYSIAKRITQNDHAAADVLIDTFLEVCSDLPGCPDGTVWLRLVAIAVRESFTKLHNRGQDLLLVDRDADSHEDPVFRELPLWGDNYRQRYSREHTTRILDHGLWSLDPMCRTVFVLRDIEEISVEDIAKIANRSVAAVKVDLLRARLQLREILARQMWQQ